MSASDQLKSRRRTQIILCAVVAGAAWLTWFLRSIADPVITVSKDTTRFTGPINPDGTVDFCEAVNLYFSNGIEPEKNSAITLYEILGPAPTGERLSDAFFSRLGMPMPPEDGEYFTDLATWLDETQAGDMLDALEIGTQTGPWSREDLPRLAAWLESQASHLDGLKAALDRPDYFVPLNRERGGRLWNATLPGVMQSRWLLRALIARAFLHLHEARLAEAVDDLLTGMRLGRHVGQGASLIERRVGLTAENLAIRGLLQNVERLSPDRQMVARIRSALSSMPPIPEMVESVDIFERAAFLDTVVAIARGESSLDPVNASPLQSGEQADFDPSRVEWDPVLRTGNQWFDRLVQALQADGYASRIERLDQIGDELRELTSKDLTEPDQTGSRMAVLYVPSVREAMTARDRCRQYNRNLSVALALSLWHEDHGDYPDQLVQLTPEYIESVPDDLFDAGPLQYARTANGYLLYSLGPNRQDDNGQWHPDGDDLAVRVSTTE